MLLMNNAFRIVSHNLAAVRFFDSDGLVGKDLPDLLITSGMEFEGTPLIEAIDIVVQRSAPAGLIKLQVRRSKSDAERLLVLQPLTEAGPGLAWSAAVEGSNSREDLVQLRAKAREAAHSLNNVVMTAVGNVSLARLRLGNASEEATRHLDAAERNLLQVRDITRDLQQIAKKDLPLA
jgi:signal transduction histidine kinase